MKTAEQKAETCRPFTGHSGANVTLHTRHDVSFVRKQASLPTQNARLRQQHDKQQLYRNEGTNTPEILRQGEIDGLYYFDMEYVPAISIAACCCEGQPVPAPQLETLTKCLATWLRRMKTCIDGAITPDIFQNKIQRIVVAGLEKNHSKNINNRLRAIGEKLENSAWPTIPKSGCHGDLTTENILLTANGKIFLIDFDSPDISSYFLDIGKLYQDLMGFWCLRRLTFSEDDALKYRNAQMALRRIRTDLEATLHAVAPEVVPHIPLLVCLNLFRAFPYATDDAVCKFILDRAESILANMCSPELSTVGQAPY